MQGLLPWQHNNENRNDMKKNEIKIGATYDWGGYVAEVIDIIPEGVVIECQEVGQDVVKPSSLKKFEPAAWGYEPW